jgi:penicillin-binding protein 1A
VTGGGLPAEIWHEVMVRVEDGMPAKELPMIVPAARKPPVQAAPEAAAPQPPAKAKKGDAITSILEGILGQGN